MGKLHGTLAKAGKVRKQTPKVAKKEKKRGCRGRALKRIKYNRRFANVVEGAKRKGPNFNAGRAIVEPKKEVAAKPPAKK